VQSTAIKVDVHDDVGRLVFVLVVLHFRVLISARLSLAHTCGFVLRECSSSCRLAVRE